MRRKNEELKNEKDKVQGRAKLYLEKLKELESRVSLKEEETTKNEALEAKDDDVVEVNSKASGADGDIHEKHLC
ncbi:hypothetical protein KY290_013605 [Solanum tuberosum]|uniref:Uncharacterized protein n=1 Tax=Solanum tuberosum TaxID=4113 RepID=A0ABQ7VM90_SOLTU|nr:hypothetical protein KY289_013733 [Solanum tuberosum]KAH0769624.1 hypothetical protein KY290_013605 [Solanum tuberosum]